MANIKIRTRSGTVPDLVRPHPQDDGQFGVWVNDHDKFSAYVHADVLDFIKRNGDTAAPHETIGLLAGRFCQDPVNGPYTLVMAAENALPGEYEASPGDVKLKAVGQTRVRRRLEGIHPDREIIGWYHSHPSYAPVFSYVDTHQQKTWNDQNSIGIVYSTDGDGAESFGVYRGPDSVRLRAVPHAVTRTPQKIESSLPPQDTTAYLTPRPEPLEVKENLQTSTPAARSLRIQIVIFSVLSIICVAQLFGLYRLDRRLAFTEGQLYQLSASSIAHERVREPAPTPVPFPSATSATSDSSASQTDGPELRVPAKPRTAAAAPRQQPSPTRSSAETTPQTRRTTTANKRKEPERTAKKSGTDKTNGKKPTPTSATTSDPRPANDPTPKATPK